MGRESRPDQNLEDMSATFGRSSGSDDSVVADASSPLPRVARDSVRVYDSQSGRLVEFLIKVNPFSNQTLASRLGQR